MTSEGDRSYSGERTSTKDMKKKFAIKEVSSESDRKQYGQLGLNQYQKDYTVGSA